MKLDPYVTDFTDLDEAAQIVNEPDPKGHTPEQRAAQCAYKQALDFRRDWNASPSCGFTLTKDQFMGECKSNLMVIECEGGEFDYDAAVQLLTNSN